MTRCGVTHLSSISCPAPWSSSVSISSFVSCSLVRRYCPFFHVSRSLLSLLLKSPCSDLIVFLCSSFPLVLIRWVVRLSPACHLLLLCSALVSALSSLFIDRCTDCSLPLFTFTIPRFQRKHLWIGCLLFSFDSNRRKIYSLAPVIPDEASYVRHLSSHVMRGSDCTPLT